MEAGIFDRDLACADRSLTAVHSSAVAAIDGQVSVKRLAITGTIAPMWPAR